MVKQLNSRLKELEFSPENPFEGDILGRKANAEILTSVVDTYSRSGCVLAINGAWGSGKTTFVKMWQAYLESMGYPTLFFNAWESDYMDDPFVALLSELRQLNPDNPSIKKAVASAGKIILAGGSSILKDLVKNKIGVNIDAVMDEVKEFGAKSLDEYTEYKRTQDDFKSSLISFTADNAFNKPVVFFVDELDRCRPDYAVKVLERIKHLFDIPNIVFVLSINKKQLGYAIQGFYGTSNMDSDDYLRRFIDHEYTLPRPVGDKFVKYLYEHYDFSSFLNSDARRQYRFGDETEELLNTAIQMAEICNLDYRTLDRVFSSCRITLQSFKSNTYLLPDVTFILCLLKVKYNEIFEKIRSQSYSVQGLIDDLENRLFVNYKPERRNPYDRLLEFMVGTLIMNYNKPGRGEVVDPSFKGKTVDGQTYKDYPFNVKYLRKDKLNEALDWCSNNGKEQYHLGLSFILDRISLLNSLTEE